MAACNLWSSWRCICAASCMAAISARSCVACASAYCALYSFIRPIRCASPCHKTPSVTSYRCAVCRTRVWCASCASCNRSCASATCSCTSCNACCAASWAFWCSVKHMCVCVCGMQLYGKTHCKKNTLQLLFQICNFLLHCVYLFLKTDQACLYGFCCVGYAALLCTQGRTLGCVVVVNEERGLLWCVHMSAVVSIARQQSNTRLHIVLLAECCTGM